MTRRSTRAAGGSIRDAHSTMPSKALMLCILCITVVFSLLLRAASFSVNSPDVIYSTIDADLMPARALFVDAAKAAPRSDHPTVPFAP